MTGWTLGIETTAHTLSFGLVDKDGIPYPPQVIRFVPIKVAFTLERLLQTTTRTWWPTCSLRFSINTG